MCVCVCASLLAPNSSRQRRRDASTVRRFYYYRYVLHAADAKANKIISYTHTHTHVLFDILCKIEFKQQLQIYHLI